jgi:NAD(P)-dependent dehydrogenase (short-subunit alcohol dehydrogenase family)
MNGKRYNGKIALVTGGASGIGRATVLGFVHEGASVAFADISAEAGADFQRELVSGGADVLFVRCDVTDEAQVSSLIGKIVQRWGRLDVAINNVGNMAGGDRSALALHEMPLEAWEGTLGVSLRSNFLCMKHEIIQMLKQGGGVIANTSSLAGMRVSEHSSPAYAAAKAGVIHMTEHAAVLYAPKNIRVNVVAPGMTGTPVIMKTFGLEKGNEIAAAFHPMQRMVTPEELADAFLWVCSEQASAITGLTIPVDGGWAAK